MNRDEAIALLRRGRDGIKEWNAWRAEGKSIPVLSAANLIAADLGGANLAQAKLARADLAHANLACAKLSTADLNGADLGSADLDSADLSDADLGGANLGGARLIHARLRGARLGGVSLRRAILINADLNGAELISANLSFANLINADLSGADLRGAKLVGVNLLQANLSGADLNSAIALATAFADVDLSDVVGLEKVDHVAPSTIGIDTLYRSGGKIPEAFLRGCGVPEHSIKYLPSLIASSSPIDFYSCFISYSHADKPFARRLHDQLQARGVRCWLDDHEILPGDDIYQKIDQGVRQWDKVLLCASKNSLSSGWVDREVDTAIERELRLREERGDQVLCIIPLNLDDYLFEWTGSHAAALRKRLAADFRGWESDNAKFEEQLERVVKALRADEAARLEPPESKL